MDQAGVRRRGPTRATPEAAYDDAVKARRRVAEPGPGLTIGAAIELVMREAEKRERTAGTLEWYECQKQTLLRYYRAEVPLDALNAAELQAWFTERGKTVSPSTLQHHLRFLRRVFRVATTNGWSGEWPLRGLLLPGARSKVPDVFGWQEALDLVQRVRHAEASGRQPVHHAADVIEFLLRTGLRRSELSRLRPEDFDLGAKILRVRGKTANRVVPLGNEAVECCKRVLSRSAIRWPEGPVEGHLKLTPDAISRIFTRWRLRLGEPRLHPHAFRHTFATRLVERGVPLATVARLLGHAPGSFAITARYYGPREPELREAVGKL